MTRNLRILIAGAALICAGNAAALIGVAYNRSGEPDALAEMSERELSLPSRYSAIAEENSGVALQIEWRLDYQTAEGYTGLVLRGVGIPWIDRAKLAELGFDVSTAPEDKDAARRYDKMLPHKAYICLEFDGPAYQKALELARAELAEAERLQAESPGQKELETRLKVAQEQFNREENQSSRLFAIDVGPDQETLRNRHPDRAHNLILPGEVRLALADHEFKGYATLGIRTIHVPLHHRAAIVGEGGAQQPHYRVQLAIGQRAEPWILDARAVSGE